MKNQLILPVICGLAAASYTPTASASLKVLTLPYMDDGVYLVQGWFYNDYVDGTDHEAIDFKKGASFQYVEFDVHAAYSGSMWCEGGNNGGYGNRCYIEHYVDGIFFYTIYAHLESFISNGPVVQGQKIGVAGKTGTGSNDVIHLHFELQVDALCWELDCRRDPYDIRSTNVAYPRPPTNSPGLMGPNHWWASDPPTVFDGPISETCDDGLQNQGETDVDCGGPCPPCDDPPVCTNGERKRCWVECAQQAQEYPPECIFDSGPLLTGIETCVNGQWGICEMADGIVCDDIIYECVNGSFLPATYECVDGGLRDGGYTCFGALGAQCDSSFYSGWPPSDCPDDLCLTGDDACLVDNEQRACEIHCNSPDGNIVQGTQTCNSYCGNNMAWSSCNPNLINNQSPCL